MLMLLSKDHRNIIEKTTGLSDSILKDIFIPLHAMLDNV
jgi:hypothetical protein